MARKTYSYTSDRADEQARKVEVYNEFMKKLIGGDQHGYPRLLYVDGNVDGVFLPAEIMKLTMDQMREVLSMNTSYKNMACKSQGGQHIARLCIDGVPSLCPICNGPVRHSFDEVPLGFPTLDLDLARRPRSVYCRNWVHGQHCTYWSPIGNHPYVPIRDSPSRVLNEHGIREVIMVSCASTTYNSRGNFVACTSQHNYKMHACRQPSILLPDLQFSLKHPSPPKTCLLGSKATLL